MQLKFISGRIWSCCCNSSDADSARLGRYDFLAHEKFSSDIVGFMPAYTVKLMASIAMDHGKGVAIETVTAAMTRIGDCLLFPKIRAK